MTTMIVEVYDALVDAGAEEEKARAAARAVAEYDRNIAEIRGSLTGTGDGIWYIVKFQVEEYLETHIIHLPD